MVGFGGVGGSMLLRELVIAVRLSDIQARQGLRRLDAETTRASYGMSRKLSPAVDRLGLAFAGMGIAATAAIMGIVNTVRTYEKELTLASLAQGAEGASSRFKALNRENDTLSKSLKRTRTETVKLQRSIEELGVEKIDPSARAPLTRAALQFGALTDFEADRASKLAFRISRSTRGDLQRTPQLMSAILLAGQRTGAGPTELAKELEALQTLGTINFKQGELITLASLLAELDPTRRESIRTSIFRQISTEVPQNAAAFAAFFGRQGFADLATAESVRTNVAVDPAQFFAQFAQAIESVPAAQRAGTLEGLGLANQRDKVFAFLLSTQLGTEVGQRRWNELLREVNDELGGAEGTLELTKQYGIFLKTLDARITDATRATEKFRTSMGLLAAATATVLTVYTGLLDVISENPILAAAAAITILTGAIVGLRAAMAWMGAGRIMPGFRALKKEAAVAFGFRKSEKRINQDVLLAQINREQRDLSIVHGMADKRLRESLEVAEDAILKRKMLDAQIRSKRNPLSPEARMLAIEERKLLTRELAYQRSLRTGAGKVTKGVEAELLQREAARRIVEANIARDQARPLARFGRAIVAPVGRVFGKSALDVLPKHRFMGLRETAKKGWIEGTREAFERGSTKVAARTSVRTGTMAAAGFLGKRAIAGVLSGPIGWILTSISVLEPVFTRLGQLFRDLGEQGGLLGLVFKGLAAVMNTIAIVGKVINLIFDTIFALIKRIPGVGWLMENLNKGGASGIGFQERILGGLDQASENVQAFGEKRQAKDLKQVTVNNDINVTNAGATFSTNLIGNRALAGVSSGL